MEQREQPEPLKQMKHLKQPEAPRLLEPFFYGEPAQSLVLSGAARFGRPGHLDQLVFDPAER